MKRDVASSYPSPVLALISRLISSWSPSARHPTPLSCPKVQVLELHRGADCSSTRRRWPPEPPASLPLVMSPMDQNPSFTPQPTGELLPSLFMPTSHIAHYGM